MRLEGSGGGCAAAGPEPRVSAVGTTGQPGVRLRRGCGGRSVRAVEWIGRGVEPLLPSVRVKPEAASRQLHQRPLGLVGDAEVLLSQACDQRSETPYIPDATKPAGGCHLYIAVLVMQQERHEDVQGLFPPIIRDQTVIGQVDEQEGSVPAHRPCGRQRLVGVGLRIQDGQGRRGGSAIPVPAEGQQGGTADLGVGVGTGGGVEDAEGLVGGQITRLRDSDDGAAAGLCIACVQDDVVVLRRGKPPELLLPLGRGFSALTPDERQAESRCQRPYPSFRRGCARIATREGRGKAARRGYRAQ